MKDSIVIGLLLSLLAMPSALRALQGTTVPQDPSALGYLNLHQRHPDGDSGPSEFASLTSAAAMQGLNDVRSFLESFHQLTRRSRSVMDSKELQAIGNTEGDMQTIGFYNIPLVIEGTILKQDYQLQQVNYELAQMRRDRGLITQSELDRAEVAYQESAKNFQVFWDTKLPTD